MSDAIVERCAQTRQAPPKCWRNVYWMAKRIPLRESESHAEGDYGPRRFVSRRVWPTPEIAEAYALRSIQRAYDRARYRARDLWRLADG